MKKAIKYDMTMAYNKDLRPSARLHYLENARHDKDGMGMYKKGVKMESAKQERKNLMKDMPIDKRATGVNMAEKGMGMYSKGVDMAKKGMAMAEKGMAIKKEGIGMYNKGMAMKGTFMSKHNKSM